MMFGEIDSLDRYPFQNNYLDLKIIVKTNTVTQRAIYMGEYN